MLDEPTGRDDALIWINGTVAATPLARADEVIE
jgi:hypothetical protein